jgi:hypothetical protein
VGLDASARASLPPGLDFIVHLVPVGLSKIKLTGAQSLDAALAYNALAQNCAPIPAASLLHDHKIKPASRQGRTTAKKQPHKESILAAAATPAVVLTPPTPPAPAQSASTQQPIQAALQLPAPTQAMTFAALDEALRAAPSTQTLNLRTKQGGVVFRITAVGRVGEQQVIRYAIANEEDSDFFVSIVNVSAGGKPLQSETAGPYSCAAGSEVYGIVHFLPAASATVAVELVQSGGQRRHFSLKPEIPL